MQTLTHSYPLEKNPAVLQKTTAVILTVACPVLILSPALLGANSSVTTVLSYSFTAFGVLCLTVSIPFYIASHKNKKKATSLSFKPVLFHH